MSHCQNENLKGLLFLLKFHFEEMEEEKEFFFFLVTITTCCFS